MRPTDLSLIRPHRPVSERVICTGDPGRALRLAQLLCDGVPAMLNHNRGLWGYSGTAADGLALTVQATGVGGPSAAAVVADLLALGARRIVRVGTCARVSGDAPPLGSVLAAASVRGLDGTSRALGAPDLLYPDRTLQAALAAGADAVTAVASVDVWPAAADAAPVCDLQAAALLAAAGAAGTHAGAAAGTSAGAVGAAGTNAGAAAANSGAAAAVLLVVGRDAGGGALAEDRLFAAEARAGALALRALA